jgi:phage terminase small subunit
MRIAAMGAHPMPSESPRELSQKQLNFCHRLVEGNSAADAYRLAYDCSKMSAGAVKVEASRLLDNPTITLTVEGLRADVRKRHDGVLDRVIAEYSRIAFANLHDFLTVTKKGATVDLSALTRDQAVCLSEIVIDHLPAAGSAKDAKVSVVRTRIKLFDKIRALDGLAKILGPIEQLQTSAAAGPAKSDLEREREQDRERLAELSKRYSDGLRNFRSAGDVGPNGHRDNFSAP